MAVSWNATMFSTGIQGSVSGDDGYVYFRTHDINGDSFRLAYSKRSNSLFVMRTVDGEDETLKTL